MDTKRDRDGLQSALTQTQQALDVEVAARADLQTLANQLKEKLNFQQQLHEKVKFNVYNFYSWDKGWFYRNFLVHGKCRQSKFVY